jgi:hypothetical protein
MKTVVVLLMAASVLASCTSTPNAVNGVSAPLQDPWQPVRLACKDPARHISVCVQGPGGATELKCSCMSPNEVSRAGVLPLQPEGPISVD